MSVVHAESSEQYEAIKASSPLMVAKFSAVWCGPCRAIAPLYEELSTQYPQISFVHVDIDQLGDLPDAQSIRGVPTFKFFCQGHQLHQFSGASKQELSGSVQQLSQQLPQAQAQAQAQASGGVVAVQSAAEYEALKAQGL